VQLFRAPSQAAATAVHTLAGTLIFRYSAAVVSLSTDPNSAQAAWKSASLSDRRASATRRRPRATLVLSSPRARLMMTAASFSLISPVLEVFCAAYTVDRMS
jgi:hypothetical protein